MVRKACTRAHRWGEGETNPVWGRDGVLLEFLQLAPTLLCHWLELGLDSVSAWLVVMHTRIYTTLRCRCQSLYTHCIWILL